MNALSIKQKLIFINFLSIAVILTFAFMIGNKSYQEYNNHNQTNKYIKTSVKLSTLLHKLQRERGSSSSYIVSKNNDFNTLTLKEQAFTDKEIKEIDKIYLDKLDLVNSLSIIRKKVADKSVSTEEVITHYSILTTKIITLISEFSNIPKDPEVRDFFKSFVVFIKAKEKVGIERALLAHVFTTNNFTLKQFEKVTALTSEQQILLEVFMQTTTPQLYESFQETIKHKVFMEVEKIKTLALSRYQDINIDSVYWFELVSLKMDELKEFENKITKEIIILSENKAFTAQGEYLLVVIITLIIFLYSLLISYSIGNNIVNSYEKLKDTLALINTTVIVSETDIHGVITYASQAFCDISGYTEDELIGHPHNLLRHEDMAKDLFKDLWTTIKSNKTWHGELKNKKKDGTFYWVKATITPKYSNNGDLVGYTAVRQDITDKKMVEELSITDGLTGLYNRRHFDDLFPKIINTSKRNHKRVCFIMLDVDFFKLYNDTYGHQKGDDVLIKISNTIKSTIKRAGDFPFRLGGEEFGIIFETKSNEHAINLANTLKTNIQDLQISHEKSPIYKVITVSIGLICKDSSHINSKDALYKEADDLLYKAKEAGRNIIMSSDN